jgi:hypothetical protein
MKSVWVKTQTMTLYKINDCCFCFRDIFLEKHWRSVLGRSVCDYFFEAQGKVRFSFDGCLSQKISLTDKSKSSNFIMQLRKAYSILSTLRCCSFSIYGPNMSIGNMFGILRY